LLSQGLEKSVEANLRKSHKVKRLNKQQKEIAESIANIIVANEPPEKWKDSIGEYCENPVDKNHDTVKEITDIAIEHQVNTFMASVLYHSKTDKEDENATA
jgi:hypothetical protein